MTPIYDAMRRAAQPPADVHVIPNAAPGIVPVRPVAAPTDPTTFPARVLRTIRTPPWQAGPPR